MSDVLEAFIKATVMNILDLSTIVENMKHYTDAQYDKRLIQKMLKRSNETLNSLMPEGHEPFIMLSPSKDWEWDSNKFSFVGALTDKDVTRTFSVSTNHVASANMTEPCRGLLILRRRSNDA